jgi:fused signal recognition particle receptor
MRTVTEETFMHNVLLQLELWAEALRQYVQANPDEISVALLGLLFVVAATLWLAARAVRRARETLQLLQHEVEGLRAELRQAQAVVRPEPPFHVLEEAKVTMPAPAEAPTPLAVAPAPATEAAAELKVPREAAIRRGLTKSRTGLLGRLASFFTGARGVDPSMLEELEEVLILSDVGARTASALVEEVRGLAEKQEVVAPAELKQLLKDGILQRLVSVDPTHPMYAPTGCPMVVLVVGVNGVGKTTTVAKLASKYQAIGKKVLVVAADTFRAAAVEQLAEWSNRVGFTLVRGPEGAKPGAVVFDGMVAAKEGSFDVVLIDTAGRLHNKSNLMQELEGVRNSIRKHIPDAPHETVLVLDGVSGQNALVQAREFNSAVQLTGIVVTKLDGTPKGGIIVAISQELELPVFYIGVGERVDDLIPFERRDFVEALFEESSETGGSLSPAVTHMSSSVMNQ